MAESLAALGTAANIVQFVDFGIRLFGKTQEIYQSADGSLKEHVEISQITDDVISLSHKIRTSSTVYGPIGTGPLKTLVDTCDGISTEMQHLLGKMRRRSQGKKTWQSVKASIHSIRKAREVQGIDMRLWRVRAQICFHLTTMLQYGPDHRLRVRI